MKLLLDTHIVLWAAGQPEKLSESARVLLTTPENALFSPRSHALPGSALLEAPPRFSQLESCIHGDIFS